MKDELQSKLVEILTSIQGAASKTADFALEQPPDIAQQYVAYGRASSLMWFLAFLAASCLATWVATAKGYCSTAANERIGGWAESRFIAAMFGTIAAAILWFLALYAGREVLLAWMAPKVWLLKEIAGLLK